MTEKYQQIQSKNVGDVDGSFDSDNCNFNDDSIGEQFDLYEYHSKKLSFDKHLPQKQPKPDP